MKQQFDYFELLDSAGPQLNGSFPLKFTFWQLATRMNLMGGNYQDNDQKNSRRGGVVSF